MDQDEQTELRWDVLTNAAVDEELAHAIFAVIAEHSLLRHL